MNRDTPHTTLTLGSPARNEIRVFGRLDPSRAKWLDGTRVIVKEGAAPVWVWYAASVRRLA